MAILQHSNERNSNFCAEHPHLLIVAFAAKRSCKALRQRTREARTIPLSPQLCGSEGVAAVSPASERSVGICAQSGFFTGQVNFTPLKHRFKITGIALQQASCHEDYNGYSATYKIRGKYGGHRETNCYKMNQYAPSTMKHIDTFRPDGLRLFDRQGRESIPTRLGSAVQRTLQPDTSTLYWRAPRFSLKLLARSLCAT